MKKLICITLVCIMLLSVGSVVIQADESQYPIVPQLEKYLVEDINHYFVPQGYEVRWCFDREDALEYFLNNTAKENIPFVVSLCTMKNNADIHIYNYEMFLKTNPDLYMTNDMLRTFYLDNESAIRSFVAPWTLYNGKTGELYTWHEIMAMSESELLSIDFKTPDFEKFITNLKQELEARNWWKEEYQERYNILYSHKDDYKNTLDEKENFVIDGVTYNFATLYYEFNTSQNLYSQNITCVNIHSEEFKNVYMNISDDIAVKYRAMFDSIEQTYNGKPDATDYYGAVLGQPYMHEFIEYIPNLSDEKKKEIQEKSFYELFEAYFNYGVPEEDIRAAMVEYNYIARPWSKFEASVMDEFFSAASKKEAIEVFISGCGLIVDVEEFKFISVIELISPNPYKFNLSDEDDIKQMIADIKIKHENASMDYKYVEDDIAYLESLLDSDPPATGENTVLYLAIACGAVAAMTAVVVRRKREAVE